MQKYKKIIFLIFIFIFCFSINSFAYVEGMTFDSDIKNLFFNSVEDIANPSIYFINLGTSELKDNLTFTKDTYNRYIVDFSIDNSRYLYTKLATTSGFVTDLTNYPYYLFIPTTNGFSCIMSKAPIDLYRGSHNSNKNEIIIKYNSEGSIWYSGLYSYTGSNISGNMQFTLTGIDIFRHDVTRGNDVICANYNGISSVINSNRYFELGSLNSSYNFFNYNIKSTALESAIVSNLEDIKVYTQNVFGSTINATDYFTFEYRPAQGSGLSEYNEQTYYNSIDFKIGLTDLGQTVFNGLPNGAKVVNAIYYPAPLNTSTGFNDTILGFWNNVNGNFAQFTSKPKVVVAFVTQYGEVIENYSVSFEIDAYQGSTFISEGTLTPFDETAKIILDTQQPITGITVNNNNFGDIDWNDQGSILDKFTNIMNNLKSSLSAITGSLSSVGQLFGSVISWLPSPVPQLLVAGFSICIVIAIIKFIKE